MLDAATNRTAAAVPAEKDAKTSKGGQVGSLKTLETTIDCKTSLLFTLEEFI